MLEDGISCYEYGYGQCRIVPQDAAPLFSQGDYSFQSEPAESPQEMTHPLLGPFNNNALEMIPTDRQLSFNNLS
jgi:hypothetical protein